MKQILLALTLLAGITSYGQLGIGEKIEGNGNIKKETRKVSDYTAIASSGSIEVIVTYGNGKDIEVEADENLLPYIITEIKDHQLVIKTKNLVNINSSHKIAVHAALTKITSLQLSGSGNIMGEGKFSSEGEMAIKLSGSGGIHLSFTQTGSLNVAISGSGNIQLDGITSSINASISGSGNIDCNNVVCDDASAKISGSGNVKVFANKSLTASISGSGNVYYKGPASDIKKKTSGSGRVRKV